MLVHLEYIEWDKWGIDPGLILEETMYNLTNGQECSQLLIHKVFDEKVYTHVLTALTHSVRPVTMADIPCVLGSNTECMAQIMYEWTPHRSDW